MAKIAASLYRGYRRRDRNRALDFSLELCSLGGPVFDELSKAIGRADWERIFEGLKIDPRDYRSSSEFARDYLAVSILSKYPQKGYKTDADRLKAALEKFRESEAHCKQTNERLKGDLSVPLCGNTAAAVIHTAARKIESLLGPFSWDLAERYMGFGPGATYSLPRKKGDPYYKFGFIPEATPNCDILALASICRSPRWYEAMAGRVNGPFGPADIPLVPGNRITAVPKNAKTDRVIAIEPTMNMFVQKGIGGLIRSRLRRVGINLNDQRLNQLGALTGSIDGSLATIDLKNASDSVSLELCRLLLPPDWMLALEQCRSPIGVLPDGEVIPYQKVSSMGNGFTFELESLLFWAICRAVGEVTTKTRDRRLLVYGDDIVIPTDLVEPVLEALSFFGFTPNMEKSFWDGPFRESCGKHYFNGVDVTPFYIREDIDTVPKFFWLHNQMIFWLRRYNGGPSVTREEFRLIELAKSYVPNAFKVFKIPYGDPDLGEYVGDIGLISSFEEARPYLKNAFGAYSFKGISSVGVPKVKDSDSYLLRQLYSISRVESAREAGAYNATPSGVVEYERVKIIGSRRGSDGRKYDSLVTFSWEPPYLVE